MFAPVAPHGLLECAGVALSVRRLRPSDAPATASLHVEALGSEFLVRCGLRFLRCYHRAWIESADAIALAAVDEQGKIVGVILGALRPETHFRTMVRRRGAVLGVLMIGQALAHPRFARELATTRVPRYARGLLRMIGRRSAVKVQGAPAPASDPGTPPRGDERDPGGPPSVPARTLRIGDVTHVMVHPDAQGQGVGRALLEETRRVSTDAGLDELVLVTLPELPAGAFYRRVGWLPDGSMTSGSGVRFERYRLPLRPPKFIYSSGA